MRAGQTLARSKRRSGSKRRLHPSISLLICAAEEPLSGAYETSAQTQVRPDHPGKKRHELNQSESPDQNTFKIEGRLHAQRIRIVGFNSQRQQKRTVVGTSRACRRMASGAQFMMRRQIEAGTGSITHALCWARSMPGPGPGFWSSACFHIRCFELHLRPVMRLTCGEFDPPSRRGLSVHRL